MKKRVPDKPIWNLMRWRKLVLERDEYKCQDCGLPTTFNYFSIPLKFRPKLEAHHIKPVREAPELIFDLNNGVTLCYFCHHARHVDMRRLCAATG